MKYLLGLATYLTLSMNGTNALLANDLMDGIHPFLCNEESFVIIEDNNTWSVANSNLEVLTTDNGWRFEDRDEGDVGYLAETRDGDWELNWLSSYGHEQWDCIDLFSATDQVVELVKQKINQNITYKNAQLEDEVAFLTVANEENTKKRLDAENEVVSLSAKIESFEKQIEAKIESLEKQLEIKTSQADYVIDARRKDRADLSDARDKIAAMTAEVTSISSELEIKKNQVEYFSTGWDKEVIKLREAIATIKTLKEELRVSQGKVKYYSNALEAERQSNKE